MDTQAAPRPRMNVLVDTPVEQVRAGDRIHISRKIGVRRVADILEYDTLGIEKVDSFTILYDAPGPGMAWENRATKKGVVTFYQRDVVATRPYRRGELVRLERLHLIERST